MSRNQGHVEIRPSEDHLFIVYNVAENGEITKTSQRLHARETAIQNAKADLNLFGGESVVLSDFTTGQTFILYADGGLELSGNIRKYPLTDDAMVGEKDKD